MAIINVNPEAKVSSFEAVKPGVYEMVIKSVEVKTQKADGSPCNMLEITFAHVLPGSSLVDVNDKPLDGAEPSQVKAYPSLESDKQGMLRSIVEACRINWADFGANPDTDFLVNQTLMVQIKNEEFKGEMRNKFGRAVS